MGHPPLSTVLWQLGASTCRVHWACTVAEPSYQHSRNPYCLCLHASPALQLADAESVAAAACAERSALAARVAELETAAAAHEALRREWELQLEAAAARLGGEEVRHAGQGVKSWALGCSEL